MSYLLEEELTAQGIATKTALKIRLNYKVYVRVKTLPMKFYERAKKIKEEYTAKNLEHRFSNTKNYFFGYSDNEISAFENSRNPRSGLDSEY
ncbi:MAG: hypothetical protein QNJ41_29090 [Xenococcaceae cyanobacterium MO_188.B32]|nr:hypothetical protein [Xenococcaceae cyanobacterium MO_188.B32]